MLDHGSALCRFTKRLHVDQAGFDTIESAALPVTEGVGWQMFGGL